MAGRGGGQFPAGSLVGGAGRAIVFGAAIMFLDPAVHSVLEGAAPADPNAALAWYTGSTLLLALLLGALLLRLLDGRPAAALGIAITRQVPRELGIGALAGVAPQIGIAALLAAGGGLLFARDAGGTVDWIGSVLGALLVLFVAAAAEEAVYRGYGFQALLRGFGRWPTLILTSGLFTIAHARNPAVTPLALGNIFLAGLVLGLAYLRTLSLWLVTALHVGWNWSMASLLDLPVSGLMLFDTPIYEPTLAAPGWLAGGAFGPEGGLAGTAALLAALFIAMRWPGVAPAPGQLAARPLAAVDTHLEAHD